MKYAQRRHVVKQETIAINSRNDALESWINFSKRLQWTTVSFCYSYSAVCTCLLTFIFMKNISYKIKIMQQFGWFVHFFVFLETIYAHWEKYKMEIVATFFFVVVSNSYPLYLQRIHIRICLIYIIISSFVAKISKHFNWTTFKSVLFHLY